MAIFTTAITNFMTSFRKDESTQRSHDMATFSTKITKSSKRDTPVPCHFLKLPPELRNLIYGLAFTTKVDKQGATTSLLSPTPPDAAMLQTCRQIYNEANQLHVEANTEYWSLTSFAADIQEPGKLLRLEKLDALKLKFINKLSFTCTDGYSKLIMRLENGTWTPLLGDVNCGNMLVVAEGISIGKSTPRTFRIEGYGPHSWTYVDMDPARPDKLEDAKRLAHRTPD